MAKDHLHDKMSKTTRSFIESLRPDPAGSNQANEDRILSNTTPDFTMSWGHKTFVESKPFLQESKDGPGFVGHMKGMTPALETWHNEITQTIVDTKQRTAMIRADFFMTPIGSGSKEERTILNDILFTFQLDESGTKVKACTEFVDPSASEKIGKMIAAAKASAN